MNALETDLSRLIRLKKYLKAAVQVLAWRDKEEDEHTVSEIFRLFEVLDIQRNRLKKDATFYRILLQFELQSAEEEISNLAQSIQSIGESASDEEIAKTKSKSDRVKQRVDAIIEVLRSYAKDRGGV